MMKKTAIIIMIITVISKVFGFFRELVLSYFYGASAISDAYLISLTIPAVIFSFVGTGLSTGFIPMFSQIREKHGDSEANKFTSNIVNILLLISTVLVVVGLIFTEPIVKLFASGFKGQTLAMAIRFTKLSLVGIYFTGTTYIYSAYLQLNNRFLTPALIGVPYNIIIIIAIAISANQDPLFLILGSVLATASQLFILIPSIKRSGYRHKFSINFRDEHLKNLMFIALPVIVGVSVNQINTLVDRTIASGLVVGGISALNYANRLNGFVQGLIVTPVATVLYPSISKMAANDNIKGLKAAINEAINSISILIMPITVGAMLFAEPIVKLLFGRGAFDANAISLTTSALVFYSIGMIGFGLRDILSRAFYSQQDTKTPMINGSIAVIMNIVLNIILSRYMGIGGLALATSISAIFSTGLLFVNLRKKIGALGLKKTAITLAKLTFASIAMGVIAWFIYRILLIKTIEEIALIVAIIIGALAYFGIILTLKIDEVDNMIKLIKTRLKRMMK
ncbi:murein biosynthesis integral membrane protein MurJ [Soehngenia longivitae]|uniref:Probable lipid II flippase MurJ n=2 Tax=Soehngenia longivitae TaxID=2562294 RepID=A0A4Z0D8H1_9FIRM|nr:murein biosynthesis integral membrane protein MurJ [Soehngenia longivitae]